MKKICIALDTSPSAKKIAKTGFNYAKALQAEVVFIHVIDNAGVYVNTYDPIMNYNGFLVNQKIKKLNLKLFLIKLSTQVTVYSNKV